MKNIFKQSEGWATPSGKNKFKKAVISLTAYYTFGVFVVLAIFNLLVYFLFANSIHDENYEADDNYSLQENFKEINEIRLREIQDNLINILLISDAAMLILAIAVSYELSKKTLAPLEEAYKKQARFVADAAHELRTPLAAMRAGSELMLRSDRTAGEYSKFIKEYLEEVKRLTALSNDLLSLARNGHRDIGAASRVDLSDICKKQTEMMRAYAGENNISIETKIEDGLSIIGNKDDLARLLSNLVKNAIDYNKPSGMVIVSLARKEKEAILSVEDTGIGIDKEDLPHIFERFYKASSSRTQNSSGTGLGLAMVKEIVEAHKGLVRATSIPGKGTEFEVILPLA
jgi:signal transduction histidine kinase